MGLKFVKKQKQPLRRVLKKRCSGNMQQIYRRTPMPKCDLNKFAHFGMGVLRISFPRNISEWLLLKFWKSNCLLVIFESENIFLHNFFPKNYLLAYICNKLRIEMWPFFSCRILEINQIKKPVSINSSVKISFLTMSFSLKFEDLSDNNFRCFHQTATMNTSSI